MSVFEHDCKCVLKKEREWWGRRMPFCYIWKSFLLGDSARFGLYQLVIAKTKPLRFPPSWLLSKHLEEREKKKWKERQKVLHHYPCYCWQDHKAYFVEMEGPLGIGVSLYTFFFFCPDLHTDTQRERYYERLRVYISSFALTVLFDFAIKI